MPCRDPVERVGLRSLHVLFDRILTKNRPKVDPLKGVRSICVLLNIGEHPGDHDHQDFPESTAIQMGGVLQYIWEAYCDTNGRSTDSIPFPQSVGAPKALRYKLEVQHKLEVCFDTFFEK